MASTLQQYLIPIFIIYVHADSGEYPANYDYPGSDESIETTPTYNTPALNLRKPYTYLTPNNPDASLRFTPSEYIRNFVKSVFRGGEDSQLDDPVEERAKNFSANPGFQGYWPGGEWMPREGVMLNCNTSDDCGEAYESFGKICASNMQDAHDTFENYCDLHDTNCRDGYAQIWTRGPIPKDYSNWRWFRVTKDPIYFNILAENPWHILLTEERGVLPKLGSETGFSISYGLIDDWTSWGIKNIQLKEFPTARWRLLKYSMIPFDKFAWWGTRILQKDQVIPMRLEFNGSKSYQGSNAWCSLRFTVLYHEVDWSYRHLEYSSNTFGFEFKWIGLGSDNAGFTQSVWWDIRGYVPIYAGTCRGNPPTVPINNPNDIREKINIDLFNMAERLDAFGYNFTRNKG